MQMDCKQGRVNLINAKPGQGKQHRILGYLYSVLAYIVMKENALVGLKQVA